MKRTIARSVIVCGILMLLGLLGIWSIASLGQSVLRFEFADFHEVPWCGSIFKTIRLREIPGNGEYYQSSRDSFRYARFFFRCTDDSFHSFLNDHSFQFIGGDFGNSRLAEWISPSDRQGFLFDENDCGFIGTIRDQTGRSFAIEGVYNNETGYMMLDVKSHESLSTNHNDRK